MKPVYAPSVKRRGEQAERARIVAWLRSEAVFELHGRSKRVEHELADAIERGEHLKD